ncbi:MAG: methionyl-tRNA formyltransferase [Acidobacteria bacterium]|nr:methionyl-tRNA formyltransferase [Acidobacteriota bacterium]
MRLAFFGTPEFAIPSLAKLSEAGHRILMVVSQPDKPRGRGLKVIATSTKAWALAHDIPVFQPPKLNTDEVKQRLAALKPEVIAVAAYGKILPTWILDLPRYGALNVHASLLPKYRGAAPIPWAIIRGEGSSGVTIMQIDPGMDTGDILLQKAVAIGPYMTGGELHDQLAVLGADLLIQALEELPQGKLHPIKQDKALATMAPMLHRDDGKISWKNVAGDIHNLVRGLCPWPGSCTYWQGQPLHIWKTDLISVRAHEPAATSGGQILEIGAGGIVVACGQGTLLRLLELQLPSRKRLPVHEFINGVKLQEGDMLG